MQWLEINIEVDAIVLFTPLKKIPPLSFVFGLLQVVRFSVLISTCVHSYVSKKCVELSKLQIFSNIRHIWYSSFFFEIFLSGIHFQLQLAACSLQHTCLRDILVAIKIKMTGEDIIIYGEDTISKCFNIATHPRCNIATLEFQSGDIPDTIPT